MWVYNAKFNKKICPNSMKAWASDHRSWEVYRRFSSSVNCMETRVHIHARRHYTDTTIHAYKFNMIQQTKAMAIIREMSANWVYHDCTRATVWPSQAALSKVTLGWMCENVFSVWGVFKRPVLLVNHNTDKPLSCSFFLHKLLLCLSQPKAASWTFFLTLFLTLGPSMKNKRGRDDRKLVYLLKGFQNISL